MNNLIASSTDSNKASLTLQGGLVMLVSVVIGFASQMGADLSAIPTSNVVVEEQVQNVVFGIGMIMSGFGSIRKVWNWLSPLFTK